MRMDADVQNLAALAEENARLHSQIDSQITDIRTLEAKVCKTVVCDLENILFL